MSLSYNSLRDNNLKGVVSIVQCQDYEQHRIDAAIDQSIRNIGGLDQFIKRGSRVHIKPNLLTAKSPEKAATTHPSVVKSIVNRVMEIGGEVTVGDSPAGISRPIEEYWRITGLEEVAQKTGAKLLKFEKKGVVERSVNGKSYFIASAFSACISCIPLPIPLSPRQDRTP